MQIKTFRQLHNITVVYYIITYMLKLCMQIENDCITRSKIIILNNFIIIIITHSISYKHKDYD